MDVREKLVELLAKYFDIGDSYCYNLTRTKNAFACGTMGFDDFEEFDDETVADIADHLIAHGVTVQEWISVKDRLPEGEELVLILCKNGARFVGCCGKQHCDYERRWRIKTALNSTKLLNLGRVTHWMPLPQPPKGE